MDLFDRQKEFAELKNALDRVSQGDGTVIALLGEAGIGKSSLANVFLDAEGSEKLILRGYCDDLGIAEPLGVLRDLAREADVDLPGDLIEPGERIRAFSMVFDRLLTPSVPTVIFVEDVHWADEATVDFLRYLMRRIVGTKVLVILTARTDETRGRNNVRRIMGDSSARHTKRIHLGPLSKETVASLAVEAGLDPDQLNDVTAGNAFFVTELLNGDDSGQSATIREAILARADRFDPATRAVLDAAAIFPRHVDPAFLSTLMERDVDDILDVCVDNGFLVAEGNNFAFRHILARRALLTEIRPSWSKTLNQRLLEQLEADGSATLSRLLYHAREAKNDAAVRRLAVKAADEAVKLGARREAQEYYRVAVDALGLAASAELLEEAAYASYLVGVDSDAVDYQNRAMDIHAAKGDPLRYGNGLRLRSRFHWSAGAIGPAQKDAEEAVKALSGVEGPELAMAHSNVAQIRMLNREYHRVGAPAEAAIKLAEKLERPDILSHALNNLACALQFSDPVRARHEMERSLKIALEIGHVDHAARAFVNATYVEMYLCQFAKAKAYATRGVFYCKTQELDGYWAYLTGALALAELGLGEIQAAGRNANAAIAMANSFDIGLYRHSGSVALLRYQVRTGARLDEDEIAYLDTFRTKKTEIQRLIPYAETMAEYAWMRGEGLDNAIGLLNQSIKWAPIPEVAQTAQIWLKRLDPDHVVPEFEGFLDCHLLEAQGDFGGADAAWSDREAPYEQALCLAQGDRASRQRAVDIFADMDALPAKRRVRATLSRSGVLSATTPRATTRSNPAGLTRRQMDVLSCLQDGLSNAAIADHLFISPKTVDHHVSAILAKLGVRTRAEAATKANKGELDT